jgi:hypothetical protein
MARKRFSGLLQRGREAMARQQPQQAPRPGRARQTMMTAPTRPATGGSGRPRPQSPPVGPRRPPIGDPRLPRRPPPRPVRPIPKQAIPIKGPLKPVPPRPRPKAPVGPLRPVIDRPRPRPTAPRPVFTDAVHNPRPVIDRIDTSQGGLRPPPPVLNRLQRQPPVRGGPGGPVRLPPIDWANIQTMQTGSPGGFNPNSPTTQFPPVTPQAPAPGGFMGPNVFAPQQAAMQRAAAQPFQPLPQGSPGPDLERFRALLGRGGR